MDFSKLNRLSDVSMCAEEEVAFCEYVLIESHPQSIAENNNTPHIKI